MPTYLLHGFRWPRNLIRIHIILQNLDDAAAEWLMAPATKTCMLENFKTLHPKLLAALPSLQFIEQFDAELAESTPGGNVQPFAYVADVVEEVKLGVEVGDVMGRGVGNEAWAALTELRDQIAPGEKVAWFVVVCQDTDRWAPEMEDEEDEDDTSNTNTHFANPTHTFSNGGFDVKHAHAKNGSSVSADSHSNTNESPRDSLERPSTAKSFKNFFSGGFLKKSKSLRDLRRLEAEKAREMAMPPPLPGTAV
ncbi:hypothetical protein K490DRAFT_76646 [Saccharata proteae CBS 121410]|uniref:Developmental regulator protein n=1 Tax=Saccharata proteae CBS 121410 TaxID=1314787 RepID=A0A9P4HN46_9PEZI|nr:hypothetical protein K490DRAFT_76646 [Saccharata proteae CBS 121410]